MTLRATFRELCLATSRPATLAEYYRRALGYHFVDDGLGLIGTARDRRLRLIEGTPKTLGYAAYALPEAGELALLSARVQGAGVVSESVQWPGFAAFALRIADPDGNIFLFGVADDDDPDPVAASGAANLAARMQHVVLASTDAQRLLDFYIDVFGFVLSDTVVDDAGGLRTAFVRCSAEHHSLAVFLASECRLDHHCLEAVEWSLIRDWSDHFAGEYIPLQWGPGRHGPGNNLFVFVHDPDCNWVEISAELENVGPNRVAGCWPQAERTLNTWGKGFLRS